MEPDMAEFVEDYLRSIEGRAYTNREVAEAYAERLDTVPLDEDENEEELNRIEIQIAYYTGQGI